MTLTAIEVKSDSCRDILPGMAAFEAAAHMPVHKSPVGGGGTPLDAFLSA